MSDDTDLQDIEARLSAARQLEQLGHTEPPVDPEPQVPLLRADPHQWGSGSVHQIDVERDRLLCGKTPANCPGTKFFGPVTAITCKACLRSIEAKAKHAEWEQQDRQAFSQAEADREEWWRLYELYLQTQTWARKRYAVLKRANFHCEGCVEQRPATQVHHMKYPRDCWPGTPEWISKEKLWDLKASCRLCHEDVHR